MNTVCGRDATKDSSKALDGASVAEVLCTNKPGKGTADVCHMRRSPAAAAAAAAPLPQRRQRRRLAPPIYYATPQNSFKEPAAP